MQDQRISFSYHLGDLPWSVMDMLTEDASVSMAHCVSADVLARKWASRGVASAIVDTFCIRAICKSAMSSASLAAGIARAGHLHVGSVLVVTGVWQGRQVTIIHLITKAEYFGKPTHESFKMVLENMFFYLWLAGCGELHIPLLGCGRDGQLWSRCLTEPGGNGRGRPGVFCIQDLIHECSEGVQCLFHVHHQAHSMRGRDTCERQVKHAERCYGKNVKVELICEQKVFTFDVHS